MDKKKRISLSGDNIAWGLTAFIVICGSIVFYMLLTQMKSISNGVGTVIHVFMPLIMGGIMAYLLLPVFNSLNEGLLKLFSKKLKQTTATGLSKAISTIVSMALLFVVVVGLLILAVPQIIQSGVRLVESMPATMDAITHVVERLLRDYPTASDYVVSALTGFENDLVNIFTKYVIPQLNNLIGSITKGVINAVGFLFNLIIGIIVCVYILNSKDTFAAQGKRLVYSLCPAERGNEIIANMRRIHKIFSGFISGKILDSLIIGLITYVVLSIINMPYCILVSTIVGVTNFIPFFGPFIGAIPSIFIIMTEEPVKALYFLIYVIIIQQIDGNIIGPKILGNSTGLPSFWVMFAILVAGGFFGFVGMLLGVPVFATIYLFVGMAVEKALARRNLATEKEKYLDLYMIDADSGAFITMDEHKAELERQAAEAAAEAAQGRESKLQGLSDLKSAIGDVKDKLSDKKGDKNE